MCTFYPVQLIVHNLSLPLAYAKSSFSHDAIHLKVVILLLHLTKYLANGLTNAIRDQFALIAKHS